MMLCLAPAWKLPTVTTAGCERIDLAADQGLQRHDDPAGEHDRILGRVRIGAVAADAAHQDVDAVDIGERRPGV
jgi:hypothetical protein